MTNSKPARRNLNGKGNNSADSLAKPTSPGRHEYHCRICSHAKREEIEQAFVTWNSPVRISKEYGVSRDSVYRHAHALGLMAKRRRNVRSALERIIEKAGEVEASAAAVVSAVAAYAKINANGQWVDRSECVNLKNLAAIIIASYRFPMVPEPLSVSHLWLALPFNM